MQIERISYAGWEDCVRLSNGTIELIITTLVGPRIIHCGFCGGQNLFATIQDELGGRNESDFQLRGGHRFWIAPEDMTLTYEPDNKPVEVEYVTNGVRVRSAVGERSGCQKQITITMDVEAGKVDLVHRLTNCGDVTRQAAPWALSVMAPGGIAVIPLPPKIPHAEAWLHNQLWTVWPYTDFSDGRWTFGKHYLLFRQDVTKGPAKLGIAQREGWAAYQLGADIFLKRFSFDEHATYPDGGVNFETFSNEQILELETLGALVDLAPGESAEHTEAWELQTGTPPIIDEQSAAALFPAKS